MKLANQQMYPPVTSLQMNFNILEKKYVIVDVKGNSAENMLHHQIV